MKKLPNNLFGKPDLYKVYVMVVLHLACSVISFGQVENVNPDTTGVPWMTGGVPIASSEWSNKINQIPDMVRTSTINPPSSIDNSTNKFMRPIFNQGGGSCARLQVLGMFLLMKSTT